MARQISIMGSFIVKDCTGKNTETKKDVNFPILVNQKVDLLEVIPKNTTDQQLPMNGLQLIQALYMNPDSEISVKFNSVTNSPITLSGPLMMLNAGITAIYVSTGPLLDVSLESILGGP
jgi:hypothetical protein